MLVFVSLGATPEVSVTKLYDWLDAVASMIDLHETFVFDGGNTRVVGCYHHMSVQQEAAFRSVLHSKLQMWGVEAVINQLSCGHVLEVSGGAGVFFTAMPIGPFQGYM